MDVEFIRVYNNGTHVVAEFERRSWEPPRKFVLNAENLEHRIRVRERQGLDTEVERKALSLVRGHKDYRPAA